MTTAKDTKRKSHAPYGERFTPYRKFTGSVVPDWLERRPELNAGPKLCYGRLARYAGADGDAFPSHKRLASDLGVSVSTSERWVAELKGLRLIEAKQRGLAKSNSYYFLTHPWMDEGSGPSESTDKDPQVCGAGSLELDGPEPSDMTDTRESLKRPADRDSDDENSTRDYFRERVQEALEADSTDFPTFASIKKDLEKSPISLGSSAERYLRREVEAMLYLLGVRPNLEVPESRMDHYMLVGEVLRSSRPLVDALIDAVIAWPDKDAAMELVP